MVVKPVHSKMAHAHIRWLKACSERKKIHNEWFYTSSSYARDVSKLKSMVQNHDVLVVVGGDGTVNLAVNAIVNTQCQLAILPAGTGNDFARQFGRSIHQWRDSVFSAQTYGVDLGRANQRYFINILGLGYSADVVKQLNDVKRKHMLSYLWAGLRMLFSEAGILTRSPVTGASQNMLMLLFANGPYFAAGIRSVPLASFDNGVLNCLQVTPKSQFARLKIFLAMLFAKHEHLKGVSQTSLVEYKVSTENLDIEADGEIIGQTPVLIRLYPQAIRLRL